MDSLSSLVEAQITAKNVIVQIQAGYVRSGKHSRTVSAIQRRLDKVQATWQKVEDRHLQICAMVASKDREGIDYFSEDVYLAISDTVDEVTDFLSTAMEQLERASTSQAPSLNSGVTSQPPPPPLPVIKLPKFSGELKTWRCFRDLFVSLVHSRSDLAPVQKMQHLLTSLEGPAASFVGEVQVSNDDYQSVWNSLNDRYDCPRLLTFALLDDLRALPAVGKDKAVGLSQLRDQALNCYQKILSLGRPIHKWEDPFIHAVVIKLDQTTKELWESEFKDGKRFPTKDELFSFLDHRVRIAETTVIQNPTVTAASHSGLLKGHHLKSHSTNIDTPLQCFVCRGEHPLYQCSTFAKRSVDERFELLKQNNRCVNCFRTGHFARTCRSNNRCKTCKARHHTLLHPNKNVKVPFAIEDSKTEEPDKAVDRVVAHHSALADYARTSIPTATVVLRGPSGACVSVRAILDPAATGSFIADAVARYLRCERSDTSALIKVTGGKTSERVNQIAKFFVETPTSPVCIKAFVVKRVSSYRSPVPKIHKSLIAQLNLADRSQEDEPVHLIIGADFVGAFLLPEFKRIPDSLAFYQRSTFGWVLVGNPYSDPSVDNAVVVSHVTEVQPVLKELQRFWELEELPAVSHLSPEEKACEEHFSQTHTRLGNGQYCVHLPFKKELQLPCREDRAAVRAMYLRQEQRLLHKPDLHRQYNAFLQEYHDLGHMEKVPQDEEDHPKACYLPHHPVVKQQVAASKLRVVFNASYCNKEGPSLNENLLVGPKLQADPVAIVLRWRLHHFVLATDIQKMFRQIWVTTEHQDFQRIFWRSSPEEEICSFRLKTVTYGTACAPFLANRVLRQLAEDDGHRFPLAQEVLRTSVYVDDLLFGAADIATLRKTAQQLRQLLRAGGFSTHKWLANDTRTLEEENSGDSNSSTVPLGEDESTRVLGITWRAAQDYFSFRAISLPKVFSKRTFLSLLAKCYDPLGWVTPVVIVGKALIQLMWLRDVEWDASLPVDLAERCHQFQEQLPLLENVTLPRWIGFTSTTATKLHIHGFADASNVAYAAVIYLRAETEGRVTVSLVYAKSKVAPLKTLSIPRLELCAALLLTRAARYVVDTMALSQIPITLWSDSSVSLAWISASPSRWKVFVANRVAEIQSTLPNAVWRHINTEENPADCASRGLLPQELLNHRLWWYGPAWLAEGVTTWPIDGEGSHSTREEERREIHAFSTSISPYPPSSFLPELSSWPRLLRVVAYVFRFVRRCRYPKARIAEICLAATEINSARTFVCKILQGELFQKRRLKIQGDNLLVTDKSLLCLSPFMDADGVVRVGGRIRHAAVADSRKHPILIPQCSWSRLLAGHFHLATLHGGLQVTLRTLRSCFWLPRARSIVRQCISRCVTCTRFRASVATQIMGDLPSARVNQSRPFSHTGIDYAGPIHVRVGSGRGHKTQKAYVAVFVCLATRAIHLETATDYSTQTFLAAFRRFCARRGVPFCVYSDNGTNFVGADKELRLSFRASCKEPNFRNLLASHGVEWQFIPPASPHFGGLWEAGVKSVKHHMRRVLVASTPTLEELNTLLCSIEGILNSRPIMPLHDDPESFDALTPGHFLVGTAITEPPVPSLLDVKENRLSRWQAVQQRAQQFWRVWSADYLNSLQQRSKWKSARPNLAKGDLVLVKAPNAPPACWEMGRVTKAIPGKDNFVRVVELRTARTTLTRPISQLCKLPVEEATSTLKD